ncbi:MAG: hypothetical protein HYV09_07250 [Deltaproteobacteria bacterium]|nr:hypothetical protein [Deltaproteobacteria bacterium]
MWDMWKKSFDKWEDSTAKYLEHWMKSPLVLGPSGAMLTLVMKARAHAQEQRAKAWGDMGVATKRDQERTLHMLNQLQSRILDLEEKLDALNTSKNA